MAVPVRIKNSWTAATGPFKKSSKAQCPRFSMLPYNQKYRLMKGLTDIPGIRVGHASDLDALTGCTVILCDGGAVGGVDMRGSATGSAELDVLSPGHVDPQVHAIVLAGGSAFGLEAASGVRRFLGARGVGLKVGPHVVPIVPGAILFDLGIGKGNVRPTREMGEAAAAAGDGRRGEGRRDRARAPAPPSASCSAWGRR